ncbi:MAG TPA: outer membrane protein transport protein [Gemmatimonadales bacterium]
MLVAAAITGGAGTATAQGFAVNEHGSCAMGRSGTGVAAPCRDGSAMFFNPAGLAGSIGWTFSGGVTLIAAGGSFTDDLTGTVTDLANDPIPVPHGYLSYGINDRFAAGVGVFVPYGLGTKWPDTFEGRFNGYDNDLKSIYVQPTLAYQVHPKVSVGAGFDLVFGSVKLTQRVDLSEFPVPGLGGLTFASLGIPFHTDAADAQLNGSATGFGGHVGVLLQPTDRVSVGVRYMTRVKLDYSGTVDFEPAATAVLPPGNPLAGPLGLDPTQPLPLSAVLDGQFAATGAFADQGVKTAITLPDQLAAGIAFRATDALTVLADYQWINFKTFDTLPINFQKTTTPDREVIENYKATHAARFGFDWATSDRLTLRAGYLYHTAAAPPQTVTPLLPEGKRNELTVGLGYAVSRAVRADLAYQYIRQQDRRGRVREGPGAQAPTEALNSGLYEFFAHLVGATFTVSF